MPPLHPFDESGVYRDDAGVRRYRHLPGSVVDLLRTSVDRDPGHEAVVEVGGPRASYRRLWDSCARVAGGLRQAGITRGDRVALNYGNGLDWVCAFFGTLMAGAVAVPINNRLTDLEVSYILDDCAASLVLGPATSLPDGDPFVVDDLAAPDLAAIFYTSGTTGRPKGAMTTHENILTNAENGLRVAEVSRAEPSLRNLVSLPLFHVAACNSQLLPTLQEGGTIVIMPAFDPDRFMRILIDERIRIVSSAPALYWSVLTRADLDGLDLSGVGWATYGGAPIAPGLVSRIRRSFPNARVGNGFGLTETSSLSTFLPDEWAGSHPESVGFPAPTVDLRLAGVADGGVGELLIRGANVVAGYWRNPAATVEALGDGWLHTGDLARFDDEGKVYLVDRIKDMINRGGENVYSVEVENVLAGAPGVFEAAVIGVPDERMGEKVAAVVVPVPGQQFDADAVIAFTRERLARFKVPQYLRVQTEPLPRNAGGKVLKALLRERVGWVLVPP